MTALQMRQKRAFDERKGINDYKLTPVFILVTAILAVFIGFQFTSAVHEQKDAKALYLAQAVDK